MQPLAAEDPREIGTYRLLGRLGAGGMGRVYLGRSAGGRTVAVKAVHPHYAADEQFRARFRREVESARRVGGAWTAPVLDADPAAPVPWVATGYVAGPALGQAVTDLGPLPDHSVRALGAGLAEALAAVHALGLVHRDVKPSNVLLTVDGPLLIDFGIARATDGTASLTSTGVSMGSPGYMAPEQVLGKGVTGAADVFSLGAVLAYAATGTSPFPGDSSAALLYKIVHEEPELGPALTGEPRELVTVCLAKTPAARPGPRELARRLAGPRGAAGLVREGWLPPAVLEQVGRQAVAALNLEARAGGPQRQVAPDGGVFGPPDPSYAAFGPASGPVPFDAAPRIPDRPPGPPGGPVPWPAAGVDAVHDATTGTGTRGAKERRISLTGALGGRAGADGTVRPRRLSCTLVLSVAGALAAATTAAFVFQLLPGSGGTAQDPGGGDGGGQPPAATASPAPSTPGDADGAASDVPEAFVGTWQGTVVQDDGTPNGTVTVTVSKGEKGEKVARMTYDAIVAECRARGELRSATDRKLTLKETADPKAGPLCTGRTATVTLTRDGDALAYASDDERGGRPTARLTRSG